MSIEEFGVFFLILVRIASFMVTSSMFIIRGIPATVKIGLAFVLSLILFNVIPTEQVGTFSSLLLFGMLVLKEVLFGLALGFMTNLIFISMQMAGQIIDFQIGFSNAAYYDPTSGANISLYGKMFYWLGLSIFFAGNGHHYLIYGLARSFERVPIASFSVEGRHMVPVLDIFSGSFLTAFQISIPLVVILLLTDVVMGLLARTVPQLNIFILGMPLKVLVGTLTTILLLPAIGKLMINVIDSIPYQIDKIMQFLIFIVG